MKDSMVRVEIYTLPRARDVSTGTHKTSPAWGRCTGISIPHNTDVTCGWEWLAHHKGGGGLPVVRFP